MKFTSILAIAAATVSGLAVAGLGAGDAAAQGKWKSYGRPGNWDQLGCQKVGFIKDRDVIQVGRKEGRFSAIRLKVSGNKVHIDDVRVIYGNGEPDNLNVRSEIRAGGQTRPLDLKGDERFIDRIEMSYRSKPSFKGQARVCVEGRHR